MPVYDDVHKRHKKFVMDQWISCSVKLEISNKATCLNAAVMCLKHGAVKAQKVMDQELVQIEK